MLSPLGTPLSPSATRVMLLGAGELGKEVIIAFQRLGVEVIAVDRYENAPGHQVAHRSYTLPMTDGAALAALIERERPDLVIPEIEAIATSTLVELEETKKARVIPTARAALLTMNREGIRRLAAETLRLPTSLIALRAVSTSCARLLSTPKLPRWSSPFARRCIPPLVRKIIALLVCARVVSNTF